MCDGKWLDIETASKDGRVILAREGEWAPCHLYWSHEGWEAIEFQATRRPTHWMPLPDPPSAGSASPTPGETP